MSNKKHFQISQQAAEKLAVRFGTPLLVLSLDEIKKNYKVLKKYMPRVKIHYAIKANPHPEILRVMADMGSCFDVASDGEIRTLHDMGVDGGRHGFRQSGISHCGALDMPALRIANLLVGNDANAPALEITLGQLTVEFETDGWFALTGAGCEARLDDNAVWTGWRHSAASCCGRRSWLTWKSRCRMWWSAC